MDQLLTTSNIMFILGILGVIFSVYNYFKTPQKTTDRDMALMAQKLSEVTRELASLSASYAAHIIADQNSFNSLTNQITAVDKSVVKLTTVIEERIPRK